MKRKQNKAIIKNKYYRPAPFAYGEDFKPDDIDVSAVSPLLLATGVTYFLLNYSHQQREETLKQLRISIDGFASDKLCFYVEDTTGLMPLSEYLQRGRVKNSGSFLLSKYFMYVTLNTAEAFEFDPEECYEKVIKHYDGLPHAWPHHEYLKKEYMKLPTWEQKDLGHTLIDYFSGHILEPDIKKKQEAYEWLKSVRKYKRLVVLGNKPPTIPNSIMLYDQYTLHQTYAPNPSSEVMEEKLNVLLKGMIRLIESASLLILDPPPYLKDNLELLLKVYNRSEVQVLQTYEAIFKKLSFDGSQFRHYLFLEVCGRLIDSVLPFDLIKKGNVQNHFSSIYRKSIEEMENIVQEALKRGW